MFYFLKNNKQQIILTAVVVLFISVLEVAAYTAPSGPAPMGNNNTLPPIHEGSQNQIKAYGNTPGNYGGLSVGTFVATRSSWMKGDVTVTGKVFGIPLGAEENVQFGDSIREVNLVVQGSTSVMKNVESQSLSGSTTSEVCADVTGILVRC